jgi:hypothetical protein
LRLCLLGSLEQIGVGRVRVGHDGPVPFQVQSYRHPRRMGSLGPHRGHTPPGYHGQHRATAATQHRSSAALLGQHRSSLSFLGVPLACHIGGSITVPSGQPRSLPSDQ